MQIATTAFVNQGTIAAKYTCDGAGYSPSITVSEVPKGAKSLVLYLEDPDAPGGTFTHWLVYNIPPSITQIAENSIPQESHEGHNSTGKIGYIPPCPPSDIHRYVFTLFALDTQLTISEENNKEQISEQMTSHILEKAQIVGMYGKK